jgi:hypothetical protein
MQWFIVVNTYTVHTQPDKFRAEVQCFRDGPNKRLLLQKMGVITQQFYQ